MAFNLLTSLIPEIIVWEDISQCPETWASESDLETWLADGADAYVEQLGFVIFENDHLVVITESFIESMGLFGNCVKIPKNCIISRKKLSYE
jgi:hypothetical protein